MAMSKSCNTIRIDIRKWSKNIPTKFKCAGHTDGGFGIPDQITMPTLVMANNVTIPYIMHHGELTTQVPIINDDNLEITKNKNSKSQC